MACGVLFGVGFFSPGRSIRQQLKVNRLLRRGQRKGREVDEKRPALLGRLFEKPFETARTAVAKSAGLGRKTRSKAPF